MHFHYIKSSEKFAQVTSLITSSDPVFCSFYITMILGKFGAMFCSTLLEMLPLQPHG